MKVIRKIVDRCLNMDAKYVGKRTVTQQGANRAATPAKNEAINDALISNSIILANPQINDVFLYALSLEKYDLKDIKETVK